MLAGYIINIEDETVANKNYRKVLYTSPHLMQLVVMSLIPGQEVGMEKHDKSDQFIRIEEGFGLAVINDKTFKLEKGISIVINAGTYHNIINNHKSKNLKLYTLYAPPDHKDRLVEPTKGDERYY